MDRVNLPRQVYNRLLRTFQGFDLGGHERGGIDQQRMPIQSVTNDGGLRAERCLRKFEATRSAAHLRHRCTEDPLCGHAQRVQEPRQITQRFLALPVESRSHRDGITGLQELLHTSHRLLPTAPDRAVGRSLRDRRCPG